MQKWAGTEEAGRFLNYQNILDRLHGRGLMNPVSLEEAMKRGGDWEAAATSIKGKQLKEQRLGLLQKKELAEKEKETKMLQQQLESGLSDDEFNQAQMEYKQSGASEAGVDFKEFLNRRKALMSGKFQAGPFRSGIGQVSQPRGMVQGSMDRIIRKGG